MFCVFTIINLLSPTLYNPFYMGTHVITLKYVILLLLLLFEPETWSKLVILKKILHRYLKTDDYLQIVLISQLFSKVAFL